MQKLIDIYESLDEHGQHALIAFAQFLQTSDGQAVDVGDLSVNRKPAKPAPVQIPQPKDIPRPDAETVIVALKRLSSTYHMLDKRQLFDASSDLVSQSMMGTREHKEVIDELELIFRKLYDVLVAEAN